MGKTFAPSIVPVIAPSTALLNGPAKIKFLVSQFLLPVVSIFFVLPLISSPAFGLSSIDFWVPQTETLAEGAVQFDILTQSSLTKSSSVSLDKQFGSDWGLSYGIYEKGPVGVEAGLDWREPTLTDALGAIYGNLRVRALKTKEDGFSVAMGIDSLGFESGTNDLNLLYLVFQAQAGTSWQIELGGYSANARLLETSNADAESKGAIFGAWHQSDSAKSKWGIEWMSGSHQLGYLFGGLKLLLQEGLYGTIAYGLANDQADMKNWVLLKLSVLF